MNEQTVAELSLTIELICARKQLIEAHAQIMQYQHRELEVETIAAQKRLDALNKERERNR